MDVGGRNTDSGSGTSKNKNNSSNNPFRLPPFPRVQRQRSTSTTGSFGSSFLDKKGSLSLALRANRKNKHKTSFLGGEKASSGGGLGGLGMANRSVSLGHVVFRTTSESRSGTNSRTGGSLPAPLSIGTTKKNDKKRTRPGGTKKNNNVSSLFKRVKTA